MMKEYKYDVSLVIATYNSDMFIDECVNSLLKQNYDFEKIEVIFVNDGSTDKSSDICHKYSEKYKNIKVIDKENGGVSSARNTGIKAAKGKYIMILDADDFLSKKSIKKLVNFMDENEEDIDLAAYTIMNYRHSDKKITNHYRNQFYSKGTGVYDLKEYPYISQTTVNVIFKNEGKKNQLYDEEMHYGEDEKYDTGIVMKKEKIGFVKEATYYYRKHGNGQASEQLKNPLYCFDSIIEYYTSFFEKYQDKSGKVPPYVQGLFLNCLRWRIAGDIILPYAKEDKEFDLAMKRLQKLIDKLDVKIINGHPKMDKYHKFYLINLKQAKITTEVKDEHFTIKHNNDTLEEANRVALKVNRFKIKNNKLYILGYIRSIILLYKEPILYYVTVSKNGEKTKKKLDLFKSNHSLYKTKMEVTKILGFELEIDIADIKEVYFETEIDKKTLYCNYEFSTFTPFNKRLRLKSYIVEKKAIKFNGKGFNINQQNIINTLQANIFRYALMIIKKPSAIVDRVKYKKYANDEIWLYCDRVGIFDNAYLQFKHDIKINDGVKRYYIIDEDLENNNSYFSEEEMKKYVVRKNTKKDLYLHLACNKILTSFSTVSEYSPYTQREYKFYNDITNYDLIYLQHGVLYANLTKMYSKEFIEIDKIIISSDFEKNNLINNYNYTENDLILTGMPRFELAEEKVEKKNKILLAPSWRTYLIQDPPVRGKRNPLEKIFLSSKFYNEINNIINDKKLNELLKKNNIELDLKLHPIFSVYNEYFKTDCSNINVVTEKVNEQEYSLFITDFSSYQFDFAKIETPIIYFLPDKEEFASGLHNYRKLDLSLEKDAFGDVTYTAKDLSECIKYYIENKFKVKDKYKKRMNNFFIKNNNIMNDIYNNLKNN